MVWINVEADPVPSYAGGALMATPPVSGPGRMVGPLGLLFRPCCPTWPGLSHLFVFYVHEQMIIYTQCACSHIKNLAGPLV